jgi:arginyl-tRNA synthetase
MVLGKDGKKISSRAGGDINADQILDMARDAALQVIDSRDIDEKNKQEIAERVGQGAIRYEVLSKDAFKDIKLDIEKAVSFTGKSGSYVMYAYTRAKSILKKVKKSSEDMSETNMSEIEKTLLLRLLSYPEIVLSAANNYAPSVIADYSYGVANLFNNFYENVPVKDSKGGELNFRIALTELTANVLNSSLGILGIEVIKKM